MGGWMGGRRDFEGSRAEGWADGCVSNQLPARLASAYAWTSTPCCATIARALTSRPLVTIRASSILTRPLNIPEVQIHTSSRRTDTCIGERVHDHSLYLYCRTHKPGSPLLPCSARALMPPRPFLNPWFDCSP